MLFVSTGGVRDKSGAATAAVFKKNGIDAVELSGGCYEPDLLTQLKSMMGQITFQVHNYFPPSLEPFVLNLASLDDQVIARSLDHVRQAIRWAVELERPVYSFHAGYLIDPQVEELGNSIKKRVLNNRELALMQFGEKVLLLAEEARQEGVTLLVENNVLSGFNFASFHQDPLLLTSPEEMVSFMDNMPSNVGLLLDVAHLKVSAKTLGFDPVEAHSKVSPWIKGYHLSDNDGLTDSNQKVEVDSWFWDILKLGLDYYSLEVYQLSVTELVEQYEFVKSRLVCSENEGLDL